MARKGSEKRRTGCVTCKRRRVKCDEARPVCKRCHVGDRSCNYLDPPLGSYSWQHLLQKKASPPLIRGCPSIIGTDLPPHQARGFDYFRLVVAPALGGHLGANFWTVPVLQLATSQPAAMHGVQAISLLYERFEPRWDSRPVGEEAAALRHYNHALRLVATSSDIPDSVVLVASVLFVCIEFLRGDIASAITHCRHGTLLASSAGDDPTGAAAVNVLQHLGIFPHMFSSAEFPLLLESESPRQPRFENMAAAASVMDQILARAIRLVRILDVYRLGADDAALPAEAWTMQQALLRDLVAWKTAFESLPRVGGNPVDTEDAGRALLRMRFLVGWVWTSIAASRDETASDAFFTEFTEIVRLAKSATREAVKQSRFTFSMGTSPLLHFVVIKCRHLPTRLEALGMLRDLAQVRESVWDAETMYAIGKCIIEHEHGICLDAGGAQSVVGAGESPSDERRMRDSYVDDELVEHVDKCENTVLKRRIHMIFVAGGVVGEKLDWISAPVVLEAD